MVIENRVLQLRRQRVSKRLDWSLHVEGNHRRQQRFHLAAGQFGNAALEFQCQSRTGCFLVVGLNDWRRVLARSNLYVPKEAMLHVRATIQIEDDLGVFDLDIGQHDAVAGLCAKALGWSPC